MLSSIHEHTRLERTVSKPQYDLCDVLVSGSIKELRCGLELLVSQPQLAPIVPPK